MGRMTKRITTMGLAHLIFFVFVPAEIPAAADQQQAAGEEKIELLMDRSVECYKKKSYEKSIAYAQQARELAKKSGDVERELEASMYIV